MYFQKKRVIAMLLAGGQGSRLKVLTEKTAKPAVPFGGKYRIIDFPLSNCVNSGIDTVGILTQYQPLELNEYIGNGQPWGLNKTHSCAQVLPPYERHDKKSGWYKGTANAIYQNIDFVDRFNPDYVVILSGDHIYKMDYSAMVEYHEKHGASCTIAVRSVPLAEASRFGILNTNPDNTIYARNSALPSSYIDTKAVISDSFVAEGCEVYGKVKHSVISVGCTIGEGAQIEDAVVMPGVVIEAGAIVRNAILGENSRVCRNAVVGGAFAPNEKKRISVTSKGAVVEANAVLRPGDML